MRVLTLFPLLLLLACTEAAIVIDEDPGTGKDTAGDTDDTGSIADGAISVAPPSLDLGTIFVGQTAQTAIAVTNIGDGAVAVTLTVVGGWATAYTLDAYTSAPAAGESATHNLTLTPTTWGDHRVSVLVNDSVSGGHVEVVVSARVQLDKDGDGFGSVDSGGDDCNDDDATVNPGATDVWYDGIDSDCAGGDDYDQDGDGHIASDYGGDDCNDTDADINPSALDTWYDGVDSDCAANDDYDQDADGYVAADYGGDDCNDTDAAINPGAADIWYDGTDSDCAGNDDYDQDGDTHQSADYGGDDCNDTDAAINPGAAEVWYDGVDQDCLGGSDDDQDGDGVDYPTDCNDTDPTVTGPTTETLNGNDDDCNGIIDDMGIGDVASGVIYGSASSMALGDHGLVAMGADVTGDGLTDLLLGAPVSSTGYTWVVDGVTASTAAGLVTAYDTAEVSGDSAGSGNYWRVGWLNGPMGDVDGDGTGDLLVGGYISSSYPYYGRSYLFYGGAAIGGSIAASDFDVRFSGDSEYGSDGSRMSASGDMNGDGQADVAIGSYNDSDGSGWGGDTPGSLAVFSGATFADDTLDIDEGDDLIMGADDNDYFGYSLVLADLTGDGYDDAIVGAPYNDDGEDNGGAIYVIAGNTSLSWDDTADDAAEFEIQGDDTDLHLGQDNMAHPGDVDGDGALDLGLAIESEGDVWIFLAPSADMDLGDADHEFNGTDGDHGSTLVIDSDLDGDGADDIVLGADGDDSAYSNSGTVFVFSWSSSWGGSFDEGDARATFSGSQADGYFGSGGAGGADLDGDGLEDVALGESQNDSGASNAGAVWIIPGW